MLQSEISSGGVDEAGVASGTPGSGWLIMAS